MTVGLVATAGPAEREHASAAGAARAAGPFELAYAVGAGDAEPPRDRRLRLVGGAWASAVVAYSGGQLVYFRAIGWSGQGWFDGGGPPAWLVMACLGLLAAVIAVVLLVGPCRGRGPRLAVGLASCLLTLALLGPSVCVWVDSWGSLRDGWAWTIRYYAQMFALALPLMLPAPFLAWAAWRGEVTRRTLVGLAFFAAAVPAADRMSVIPYLLFDGPEAGWAWLWQRMDLALGLMIVGWCSAVLLLLWSLAGGASRRSSLAAAAGAAVALMTGLATTALWSWYGLANWTSQGLVMDTAYALLFVATPGYQLLPLLCVLPPPRDPAGDP